MIDLDTDAELKTPATLHEVLRRSEAQNGLNISRDGPMGLQIVHVLRQPDRCEMCGTARLESRLSDGGAVHYTGRFKIREI